MTDVNGNLIAQLRYTAFGEVRLGSIAVTDFTYTGQLSQMDEVGLMFYRARWMDPATAVFTTADTLVPDPYNPIDWNRYLYVRGNPVNYFDPAGHRACGENEDIDCNGVLHRTKKEPGNDNLSFTYEEYREANEVYGTSVDNGLKIILALKFHKGWWTPYMEGDRETMFKFLLRFAYAVESYAASSEFELWEKVGFHSMMIDALVNKPGYFYSESGDLGLIAFLGGREKFVARATQPDDSTSWIEGTGEYLNAWGLDYLKPMGELYKESGSFIDDVWNLIIDYSGGDIYGTGAWDYSTPPMPRPAANKLILDYPSNSGKPIWVVNRP